MLDCRLIRIDLDTGFEEGRQFGRGWSGAQKRDEISNKNDPDRPRGKLIVSNLYLYFYIFR